MTLPALAFLPVLPLPVLISLGVIMLGLHFWDIWRRRRGAVLRTITSALILFMLAGPHMREQVHVAKADRVAVVLDRSASMMRTDPQHRAEAIATRLQEQIHALGMVPDLSTVTHSPQGTALHAAIQRAIARIPPDQLAGVLVISDGLGHDLRTPITAAAPVHGLVVGDPQAVDIRPVVRRAPRTAAVGSQATVDIVLEGNTTETPFTVRVNDAVLGTFSAVGEAVQTVTIPITRRMAYTIQVETPQTPGDLNPGNNQTQVTITGVHDRLRVLLITGTPYPGVRAWRNLLTSDPMVDLVHFTILRTPAHEDFTPSDELSLIAFPTQALFSDVLSSFDLVIFDRYRQTGVLPPQYLENIAARVRTGGALLVISGPEDAINTDDFSPFAGLPRLSDGPLGAVLPVTPGALVEGEMVPRLSLTGLAHPVTAPFAREAWGPWMRHIEGRARLGTTLLQTPDGNPLLVVAHVGRGRVAEIMSDQAWVWTRDYKGGGPYGPLMRRVIHWLMDEPDLDEDRLHVAAEGSSLVVTRQSLTPVTDPVRITRPDGKIQDIILPPQKAGVATTRIPAPFPGVYRLTQGDLQTRITVGARNTIEDRDGTASPVRLSAVIASKQGSVMWAKDVHDLHAVNRWTPHSGSHWLGLTPRHAKQVIRDNLHTVSPAGLLILALCCWGLAWWREGR